ncbi:MAG: hypothetical protein AB7H93_18145 [Vicinamibacterales bacterium]
MPIPSTTVQRPVSTRDEAGQLAHELNNLLAVIGGHADALEPALPAAGDDHDSIVAIQRAVMAGAKLAERMRRLGGTVPAPARGVDVLPAFERASQEAARRFGHRITVVTHTAPALWSTSVASSLVEPVLWQLLTEAVDVMPHGGTLTLRCMNVEFGAARGAARRERFVRVELSGPTLFAGGGSASAVESPAADAVAPLDALALAGGRISRESDGATMATWAVLLPSDGVEPLGAPAAASRGASILVVDADVARRSLMQALLQRQGFVAHVAASVDDAARALDDSPVDLMVADAALRGLSGDAATLARSHAVKVLPIETRSGGTGAAPALQAPFTAQQLLAGVESALGMDGAPASPRVLAYREACHSEEIA